MICVTDEPFKVPKCYVMFFFFWYFLTPASCPLFADAVDVSTPSSNDNSSVENSSEHFFGNQKVHNFYKEVRERQREPAYMLFDKINSVCFSRATTPAFVVETPPTNRPKQHPKRNTVGDTKRARQHQTMESGYFVSKPRKKPNGEGLGRLNPLRDEDCV